MTLTERKIWHLPLLLLLAFWLGGCSMHDDMDDIDPGSDFYLLLNVHSGDSNMGLTRAEALGITYEQATEGRELMNTLRVIIVNQETQIVAHNDFIKLPEASTFKDGLKYKVDLNTDYKVYLIANEEGVPNYLTLLKDIKIGESYPDNELEDIVIGSEEGGQPIINDTSAELPVPMTEIFDIHTSPSKATSSANEVIQNETFFITRAASKFSFYFFVSEDFKLLDSNEEQLSIKSVKINGLGKNEYLFPNDTYYTPGKDADRTSIKREITAFRIPTEDNGIGAYTFELPTPFKLKDMPTKPENFNSNDPTAGLTDEEVRKYIPLLYFPESKGNAAGNLECTISFDGENYLPPVPLPNLPHKLPRNTHVVVVITLNGQTLDVSVDIQPFAEQKLTFQFGLMRDERGDLKVLFDKNGDLPDYFKSFVVSHKDEYRIGQITRTDDNGVSQINWVLYEGKDDNTGIILENGDYFAIVVGEYENLNEARIWIKDSDGCHVLSNYENSSVDVHSYGAREVEEFFGLNQSERYLKDALGYRQVYLFSDNWGVATHNSIVIHPQTSMMLFRANPGTITINDDSGNPISNSEMMYFRVENWAEPNEGASANSVCGHIIVSEKTSDDNKYLIAVFREILADGTLGEYSEEVSIPMV